MEIIEGIEPIGTALWIPKKKILIIGDIHIGYEEAMNKKGFMIPPMHFEEIKKVINDLLKRVRPETIVINGDLKHEFGDISAQEWFDTSRFLDMLEKSCEKIILIRGNHDKILDPIAKKRKLEIRDFFCIESKQKKEGDGMMRKALKSITSRKEINKICILHGDKLLENPEVNDSDLMIIGHDHPAIILKEKEGLKQEKYKCFLLGRWKSKKMIVMPSFLPMIEGTDIRKEELLSPYLQQSLRDFEVFVIGDKVYRFGKIKNLPS